MNQILFWLWIPRQAQFEPNALLFLVFSSPTARWRSCLTAGAQPPACLIITHLSARSVPTRAQPAGQPQRTLKHSRVSPPSCLHLHPLFKVSASVFIHTYVPHLTRAGKRTSAHMASCGFEEVKKIKIKKLGVNNSLSWCCRGSGWLWWCFLTFTMTLQPYY